MMSSSFVFSNRFVEEDARPLTDLLLQKLGFYKDDDDVGLFHGTFLVLLPKFFKTYFSAFLWHLLLVLIFVFFFLILFWETFDLWCL